MSADFGLIRLSIVVVLYKKHYARSVAIQSLLNKINACGNNLLVTLHVWNNTPEYSDALEHEDVRWYSGSNNGLSFIYNQIAKLSFDAGSDYLLVSDDDTDYESCDLISCLNVASNIQAQRNDIGVFLPKIYTGNVLISPGKRLLFLGKLLPTIAAGVHPSKNLLAINSGMIVTRACYLNMPSFYDERLKFYVTDTDFFVRYQASYKYVYVLDVVIEHDLSELTSDSTERACFRYEEMIKGLKIVFEKQNLVVRLSLRFYLLFAAIKKTLIYKDSAFLRIFFR
ncbi:hypothetical protein [Pseudomonas sp. P8_241]|uniref:glycosyltransferase family 2 protein n=1 Tax=Pseudomonas sp. P8_241 TaxID=3043445 RepID=UPI002A358CCB|nr:hypothetical protein [Pseudomonas sp. P8_241]WPN48578.1 hypothetical protein QMK58_07905 [Pseudomonas sp. P8_241]